jgi:hypothetical protein
MRGRVILDALSTRAPTIVVVTLCAALVGYWTDAPLWLPYGLATIVGALALVQMAARNRRGRSAIAEEPESSTNKSWIAHELAGNGSASGSYLLGFFALVTLMLTGVSGAYAMPAWAALALAAAWGIANARYPTGEGPER